MRGLLRLFVTAVVGSFVLLWILGRDWWTRRRLLRSLDQPAPPHSAAGRGAGARAIGALVRVARHWRRTVATHPRAAGASCALLVLACAGVLFWGSLAGHSGVGDPSGESPTAAAEPPSGSSSADSPEAPPPGAAPSDETWTDAPDKPLAGGEDAENLPAGGGHSGEEGSEAGSGRDGRGPADEEADTTSPAAAEAPEAEERGSGTGDTGRRDSADDADEGPGDCSLLNAELANLHVCL